MVAAIRRREEGGAAGSPAAPARLRGQQGAAVAGAARSQGGDGQPPPWLGAGRPPSRPGKRHVRVVIRVHHLQEAATRSLIWALRGQEQPAAEKERFTVDFALVATERKGLPVVRRIARGGWARVDDVSNRSIDRLIDLIDWSD
jgi:hypothetical protein